MEMNADLKGLIDKLAKELDGLHKDNDHLLYGEQFAVKVTEGHYDVTGAEYKEGVIKFLTDRIEDINPTGNLKIVNIYTDMPGRQAGNVYIDLMSRVRILHVDDLDWINDRDWKLYSIDTEGFLFTVVST